MIYLKLFLEFLKIGAFSFGGGYGMISLIRDTVISNGWLTENQLMNFIAVSESTPGPLAVNMATFVGSSQGGILGALSATFGVVLPSFIIILVISLILKNLLKYRAVQSFLDGIRPCIAAMILSAGIIMLLSALFNFSSLGSKITPDLKAIIIFALIALTALIFKKIKKQAVSPVLLILISAGLGILFYSF